MSERQAQNINVFWFLPTHGDGRYLGTTEGGRAVDLPYLQQVALAADNLGYYGVLIPTGKSCEDSWLVAAALAPSPNVCAIWSPCALGCSPRALPRGWPPRWIAFRRDVC